ncbi:hypothetical protein [Microlunatus endophyticus]
MAVTNPVSKAAIPHGKQRSMPVDPYDSCSFAPTSGIWQSVWWQHRPSGYLAAVELLSRDGLDGFDAVVRTGERSSPATRSPSACWTDPVSRSGLARSGLARSGLAAGLS